MTKHIVSKGLGDDGLVHYVEYGFRWMTACSTYSADAGYTMVVTNAPDDAVISCMHCLPLPEAI